MKVFSRLLTVLLLVSCIASAQFGSRFTNGGPTLAQYDVVIVDTSEEGAVTTTATELSPLVVGVAHEAIAGDATGTIVLRGSVYTVNVIGNVAIGDFLVTSTTAGSARAVADASENQYAFGVSLEAETGPGTVRALLMSPGADSSPAFVDVEASTLKVGGGYGDTGTTFDSAGEGAMDGAFAATGGFLAGADIENPLIFADGATGDFDVTGNSTLASVEVGGGQGSTGTTLETDGDVYSDGLGKFNNGCIGWDTQAGSTLTLNGDDESNRKLEFATDSTPRWHLRVIDEETGSDAGSTLYLSRYTDAGVYIDDSFEIERASGGSFILHDPLELDETLDVTGASTFTAGTFSGNLINTNGNVTARNDAASSAVYVTTYRDNDSTHGQLQFQSYKGSLASPAIVGSSTILGTIAALGWDGDSLAQAGRIDINVAGTPGDGDMPGSIEFKTSADGGASPATHVYIGPDGDVDIGGGYGSSGITMTAAGALSADSDVTYKGILRAGSGGINKDWVYTLRADDKEIFDRDTSPAAAAALVTFSSTKVRTWGKAFDKDTAENAMAYLPLPLDYNGTALKITLYWSCTAGTTGDCYWYVAGRCFTNDDTLADATQGGTTGTNLRDSFIAQNDAHIIQANLTPNNFTASPCMLMLVITRVAADGTDTFDADAILLGVSVSYA